MFVPYNIPQYNGKTIIGLLSKVLNTISTPTSCTVAQHVIQVLIAQVLQLRYVRNPQARWVSSLIYSIIPNRVRTEKGALTGHHPITQKPKGKTQLPHIVPQPILYR